MPHRDSDYIFNNCAKQGSRYEADSRIADEVLRLLWNPKVIIVLT
jgi:hypothetical protein